MLRHGMVLEIRRHAFGCADFRIQLEHRVDELKQPAKRLTH